MLAVDTNIVVRLLIQDDPAQTAIAQSLFDREEIWIAKTVIFEAVWVLQSIYGYNPETTRLALTNLLGLQNIYTEDEAGVRAALLLADKGLALPDALNLMSTPTGVRFLSCDKSLVRRARKAGVREIAEA